MGMRPATVVISSAADGQHVVIRGRIDVRSVPDVRLALHQVIDTGSGALHVDLGHTEISDATALGMLVECHRRARRADRTITFSSLCERGQRLLRAVRLVPTRSDALAG